MVNKYIYTFVYYWIYNLNLGIDIFWHVSLKRDVLEYTGLSCSFNIFLFMGIKDV